jgi:hypothetical protein
MRARLVALALIALTAALPAAARAQDGALVESFTLDAIDQETSSYQLVAGGQYGLLLKGTLTDDAGGQFDSLYCRNDACGGAGTYIDNVLGMGFTDVDRREYEGTFGPISLYVNPLPPYTSNSTSYATRFTAPRSGRLELKTNHGNFTSRPARHGQLVVDLYRYSEPGGGGDGNTTTGGTTTTDPCGALGRALGSSSRAHPVHIAASAGRDCVPGDPKRGTLIAAPSPGHAKTVYAKITSRTRKVTVTVGNAARGTVAFAVGGRRQHALDLFDAYARWCMLGLLLDKKDSALYNSLVFDEVFAFKTGRAAVAEAALCNQAAVIATVRAIEAEDAARASPPQNTAGPPSKSACKVGRVVVTSRVNGVNENVSRTHMPALRVDQSCKHSPTGVMKLTYTATGGRTMAHELGSTRFPVTIALGKDGQPGGELALRVRTFR